MKLRKLHELVLTSDLQVNNANILYTLKRCKKFQRSKVIRRASKPIYKQVKEIFLAHLVPKVSLNVVI